MAVKAKKQKKLYTITQTLGEIISGLDVCDDEIERLTDLKPGESTKVWDEYGESRVTVTRIQ